MAKKIRLPLEMKNGIKVRTMEELISNFDLEKAILYVEDGRLEKWLRDRLEDGLADQIKGLRGTDSNIKEKICDIFKVNLKNTNMDVDAARKRESRLNLLRQVTDDNEILSDLDSVAFSQEDLLAILKEGKSKIYLCGEKFEIPMQNKGVTYIGLDEPKLVFKMKDFSEWLCSGVSLENCKLGENLKKLKEKYENT